MWSRHLCPFICTRDWEIYVLLYVHEIERYLSFYTFTRLRQMCYFKNLWRNQKLMPLRGVNFECTFFIERCHKPSFCWPWFYGDIMCHHSRYYWNRPVIKPSLASSDLHGKSSDGISSSPSARKEIAYQHKDKKKIIQSIFIHTLASIVTHGHSITTTWENWSLRKYNAQEKTQNYLPE